MFEGYTTTGKCKLRSLKGAVSVWAVTTSLLAFPAHAAPTGYTYDELGHVTSVTYPDGGASLYQYDAVGNRISKSSILASQAMMSWEAEDLRHATGYAESDGWAASVENPQRHMTFGPYTTDIPVGSHDAVWKLMVDNNTADNVDVVTLDAYDSTAGEMLASRTLTRKEWLAAWQYQLFYLPFSLNQARAGHAIELRTWYKGTSYVKVDRIGVATPFYHDDSLAANWSQAFEAESLPHAIGYVDADGWAADVTTGQGHMTYGPYAAVPEGNHLAIWKMLIDNNSADSLRAVRLDIWDSTADESLGQTVVFRNAWTSPWHYEYFALPFDIGASRAGHAIEIRTWTYGNAYIRVDKIGIR